MFTLSKSWDQKAQLPMMTNSAWQLDFFLPSYMSAVVIKGDFIELQCGAAVTDVRGRMGEDRWHLVSPERRMQPAAPPLALSSILVRSGRGHSFWQVIKTVGLAPQRRLWHCEMQRRGAARSFRSQVRYDDNREGRKEEENHFKFPFSSFNQFTSNEINDSFPLLTVRGISQKCVLWDIC